MSYQDKARSLYEATMEDVYDCINKAEGHLEWLRTELNDVELKEEDWYRLDKILSMAIMELGKV